MKNGVDVNPQFLNLAVSESAANTFTQAELQTPVIPQWTDGKAMVMEILKIFVELGNPDIVNVTITGATAQITKVSRTAIITLNDPDCIIKREKYTHVFDTGATDATVFRQYEDQLDCYDLTDGAGNGYLFAKQKIYIAIQCSNCTAVKTVRAKILYRLKAVSTQEYIGIVGES